MAAASPTATSTFRYQEGLPALPVPSLEASAARFLKSVRPLLTAEEYGVAEEKMKEFIRPGGSGERYQALLLERQRACDTASPRSCWLSDTWLRYAYHLWPDPLPITSNYFLVFDSPLLLASVAPARLAARIAFAALSFHSSLKSETIKVDSLSASTLMPLCMNQYKRLFGTSRVPGRSVDHNETSPDSSHIVVISKGQYYKVDVRDFDCDTLESAFSDILEDSASCEKPSDLVGQPNIGALTGGKRPEWASARELLLSRQSNRVALETIESALFVVCFDSERPETKDEWAMSMCAGDARNRNFDKSLQFVIFANGRSGLNAEHSPLDAMCTLVMVWAFRTYLGSTRGDGEPPPPRMSVPLIKLQWEAHADVLPAIREAETFWASYRHSVRIRLLYFGEFGTDLMKKHKVRPDSFMQMAIQLAYYRLHQKAAATYETATTRLFYEGRTETIRSCSAESLAFTQAFDDSQLSVEGKKAAFSTALSTHHKWVEDCTAGKGCDRHFLALRAVAADCGEALPAIFTDKAMTLSSRFILSTSNTSPRADETIGGFGPTASDGYGCCYTLSPTSMTAVISSYTICEETSADAFYDALCTALRDMRTAFLTPYPTPSAL